MASISCCEEGPSGVGVARDQLDYAPDLIADAALAFIDANKAKPFFLYFAHYAVHAPFNSDPRFAAHYQDSGKPAPAQAFASV